MKVAAISLILSLVVLALADAYPYNSRYSRRSSRPRSRLFGSPYTIGRAQRSRHEPTRSRYDAGRPASKLFTIPGFGQTFTDPLRQSNMGFNLGLGGSALIDPLAGLYETPMGNSDAASFGVLGGVGDLGFGMAAQSHSPMSRNLDMQMDPTLFGAQNINLEFLDSGMGQFIPAAGSRSLSAMDMNAALNQPMDIASYATNMQMAGSPSNQLSDGISSIQIIDGTGLSNAEASQLALATQGLGTLGMETGNQIALGAGSIQMEGNQLGLGGSQFQAGASGNNIGINTDGLGMNLNQLGISANQFQNGQSQMISGQLKGSQLGLEGNQVLLDARQLQLGNNQADFGGGQMGLAGGQQILTTGMGPLGMGTEIAGELQGLMQPSGSSMSNAQFLTQAGGGMPNTILTTSQEGAAEAQFFSPGGEAEQQMISQAQNGNVMTSQLSSGMLSQLNDAQLAAGPL